MSARTRSRTAYAVEVHDELMSLTLRMVGEYPQFPAGSVMRCVARAVRHGLKAGTPRDHLPAWAEHMARQALAGRPGAEAGTLVRQGHPQATD